MVFVYTHLGPGGPPLTSFFSESDGFSSTFSRVVPSSFCSVSDIFVVVRAAIGSQKEAAAEGGV